LRLTPEVRAAEDLALALRDQLKSYTSTAGVSSDVAGIVASETEARKELNQAKERLSHLESMVGPEGNVQVGELVAKVEQRDQTIKALEANLKAATLASALFFSPLGRTRFNTRSITQSPEMLIKEVEQLSAAWQVLDEQSREKVLELVNYEEKVAKLTAEVRRRVSCPIYRMVVLSLPLLEYNRKQRRTIGISLLCAPRTRFRARPKCFTDYQRSKRAQSRR
jgi:E3 ubiquitin-protein ligase BRE1